MPITSLTLRGKAKVHGPIQLTAGFKPKVKSSTVTPMGLSVQIPVKVDDLASDVAAAVRGSGDHAAIA